ncbi:MAG: hypothetical protein KDE20_08810 [Caldilineaceae bacterium]|nr:hypothetical protein [Caldilineaceae bacterium]
MAAVRSGVVESIGRGESFATAKRQLEPIAREGFVRGDDFKALIAEGVCDTIDHFLSDGLLDESEESRVMGFLNASDIRARVEQAPAYRRLVQGGVLRDLSQGKISQRINVSGAIPNLQRNEVLVWAFPDTEYLEDKVRKEYVGRSQGVSIRIAKGVSYRVGGFRGRPVERQERVSLGRGTLFVTNKHMYFTGDQKTFRVPYSKIVAFEEYSDGISFTRDAATAKPQIFRVEEGWYLCNMVGILASL